MKSKVKAKIRLKNVGKQPEGFKNKSTFLDDKKA
jgi:hypothetical protein